MPIATGTRERPGRVRVWAHRVLGALGWVALVLLAVWRLPEVARTVACSIVVDVAGATSSAWARPTR